MSASVYIFKFCFLTVNFVWLNNVPAAVVSYFAYPVNTELLQNLFTKYTLMMP